MLFTIINSISKSHIEMLPGEYSGLLIELAAIFYVSLYSFRCINAIYSINMLNIN